jgi:release factor glutamine methyltransferase
MRTSGKAIWAEHLRRLRRRWPDAIRQIIDAAPRHLAGAGWLLLEHGHDQGAAVRDLLEQHGFKATQTWQDLADHDRISGGHRP